MPFTFSHPAIVLPFIKKYANAFSATGLIIGCIIPDFESFIMFNDRKLYSHTWMGIFWYDLPMAIVYAFIFHNVVRDPLIHNLPEQLSNKFAKFTGFNWNTFFRKHFLKIICSMLIGILSHLLWDAFTHLNIINPNAIDSNIYIGRYRLFKILQYSNSVMGLAYVCYYMVQMRGEAVGAVTVPTQERYWVLVTVVALLLTGIASYIIYSRLNVILLIDIVISGVLLGTILAPLLMKLAPRSRDAAI